MSAFCKILIDFVPNLYIPEAFVEVYGDSLPKNLTLEVADLVGKSWKVSIMNGVKGELYLAKGWTKFVEDTGLELADFLVFRFVNGSMFRVTIYGVHGCIKDLPETLTAPITHAETSQRAEGESRPSFSFKWKEYKRFKAHIPGSFCIKLGLTTGSILLLRNLKDNAHEVRLHQIKMKSARKDGRFGLGYGWTRFQDDSNLELGEEYKFEFISRTSDGKFLLQLKKIKPCHCEFSSSE